MTVGIGAMCHHGKCIIMAADARGSFEDPTLPPHEYIGKQYDLPFGFLANTAGLKTLCQSVACELYSQMDKLTSEPAIYHDHILRAIREAQFREFRYRVDYEMRTRLNTTTEEWKKMPEANLHYRRCDRLIRNFDLNLHITVGGFLKDGNPVLLTGYGKYPVEIEEMTAIGSGLNPALDVLVARGQNSHMSPVRTALHVVEAMEAAQQNDPYVGRCDAIVVLTANQIRMLSLQHPLLVDLKKQYAGRDSEPIDDDIPIHHRFLSELYFAPKMTRAELAAQFASYKATHGVSFGQP